MLDLWPRWLAQFLPRKNKHYWIYTLTALVIAGIAYFYLHVNWSQSQILASSYSLVGSIRTYTHFGYRCPVCGGTRSFLAMFNGDIGLALQYSFFGVFLFLSTYLILPIRFLIALGFSNRLTSLITRFDQWLETHTLKLIFGGYGLQLILDFTNIFPWLA